jgi:hypothetical protein
MYSICGLIQIKSSSCIVWSANKALVQTVPARSSFYRIARHNCFGGGVGAFPPHRARERLYNAGVSNLPDNFCKIRT